MSAYQAQRALRQDHQRTKFEHILTLPEVEQAASLFKVWPYKLPRVVRLVIGTQLRNAWRNLRTQETDRKFEWMKQYANSNMVDQIMEVLRDKYGEKATELASVVSRIPNLLSLMVCNFNRGTREFNLHGVEDCEDEIFNEFCLALHDGAGIVIRQALPLKSQVTNAKGEKVWVHQNRIYGVYAGHGQLQWMTKAEVRQSYMFDAQTGQPLPSDGFTNFGDIKEFARLRK